MAGLDHAGSLTTSGESGGSFWMGPSEVPDELGRSCPARLPSPSSSNIPVACAKAFMASGRMDMHHGVVERRASPALWPPTHAVPDVLCSALQVVSLSAPAACELVAADADSF